MFKSRVRSAKFLSKVEHFVESIVGHVSTLVYVLAIAVAIFLLGFHLGTRYGLDTKVNILGEKYLMKERGKR